ncbi:hypothetical protein ACSMXM_07270 [Pacificimonas sp. ICDLI1SI03]
MRPLFWLALLGALLFGWMIWRLAVLQDNVRLLIAEMGPPPSVPAPERHRAPAASPLYPTPADETLVAAAGAPVPAGSPGTFPSPSRQGGHRQIAHDPDALASLPLSSIATDSQATGPSAATLHSAKAPIRTDIPSIRPDPFNLAETAFTRLQAGDRREAADYFQRALTEGPDHPQAELWRAQLRGLNKRLSISAYWLARDEAAATILPTQPVFGGSQYGLAASWTLDPLARQPVSIEARMTGAPAQGGQPGIAEALVGAGWQLFGRAVPKLVVEQRIALGDGGINATQIRLSGGMATDQENALDASVYADVGIVGWRDRDVFAGGQGFTGYRLRDGLSIGAGAWGGIQRAGNTISVLEIGPALRAQVPIGAATLDLRASYRRGIAGNAANNDGAALTVALGY